MSRMIFSAGLLVDGTARGPVRNPFIVVNNGTIEGIYSGTPPEPLLQGAELLDLPDATIIPGIIDAHVHLALGLHLPEWPQISSDPVRLSLLAGENARKALVAGSTTVADCGTRYGVTIPLRDAIASGQTPGARIWAAGPWLTVTNGHGYFWDQWGLDTAFELRQGVRKVVRDGADFIKIMASGGHTHGQTTNTRRAQYSASELRFAVEDAHRLNKRVRCHCHATEAIRHCVEAGVDVIEHFTWLGVEQGTIEYDDQLAILAAQKGVFASITCRNMLDRLADRHGEAQNWGDTVNWELVRRIREAGVHTFIHSDAIGQGLDVIPHYMARLVDEDKASAADVIQMATLIPARALGLADRIGSIENGKLADMVFVAANPLVNMSTLKAPLVVVKEGRVAARDGSIIL